MSYTQLVDQLIESLRSLPGIGPRSAERMAFYLLQQGRDSGLALAKTLEKTLTQVKYCERCRTFTEYELCKICTNPKRDNSILCIVETPIDILAIEKTNSYRGLYFTLMGHLSPIDGLGPTEIGINELTDLINSENNIEEIIIATNPTIEGEATAHYIAELAHSINKVKCTRIAHGIPFGAELEYTDSNTLAQALARRTEI